MALRTPRRRPHPAGRARNIAASLSAATFVGLGGVMAVGHAKANAAATTQKTRVAPTTQPSAQSDDGYGTGNLGDNFGDDGQQSSGGFGAQPAPQGQFQGGFGSGSSSGGSNTSSHGS